MSQLYRYFGILIICGGIWIGCGSSSSTQEPANAETGEEAKAAAVEDAPLAAASTVGCQSDADCVPDSCCHPKSCVPSANAPKGCEEAMCTGECKEGTMDCGKGTCTCAVGACSVKWTK